MLSRSEDYTGGDVLRAGDGIGLVISRVGYSAIPTVSKPLHLSRILHVPQLSIPLLPVYQFTTYNNVFFEFNSDSFFVKDCTTMEVLLKGPSFGGLYQMSIPRSHMAFLSACASPVVWH